MKLVRVRLAAAIRVVPPGIHTPGSWTAVSLAEWLGPSGVELDPEGLSTLSDFYLWMETHTHVIYCVAPVRSPEPSKPPTFYTVAHPFPPYYPAPLPHGFDRLNIG